MGVLFATRCLPNVKQISNTVGIAVYSFTNGRGWYAPTSDRLPRHARPGLWFNTKIPSYQYRKSHCGEKMVVFLSYLYNGISYAGKTASLYWIRVQDAFSATIFKYKNLMSFIATVPLVSSIWIHISTVTSKLPLRANFVIWILGQKRKCRRGDEWK